MIGVSSGRRSRHHGYALPAVMLFMMIAFGMWSIVYRSSASTLRVEKARIHRDARARWTAPALALGLRVLETGVPASDHAEYKVTLSDDGETHYYRLTFDKNTTVNWTVTCEPTDADDSTADLPASFT